MNDVRTRPAQLIDTVMVSDSGQRLNQTTCPYCGVGCGIDVTSTQSAGKQVTLSDLKGTPEHPANFGRLCIKGTNLLQTNSLDGRLLAPVVNQQTASWDTATSEVAARLKATIAQHGPDSVAFYVSGQLLTEDYYIANKLMKGYIGSANIDTNSRLCMSSAVAAYKRAFGEDIVPCSYEDLESTDLLVLTGSNAAWTHPVLYQRIERAKLQNPSMKVVVIDPRQTDSCDLADVHLALRPGTDAFLFNGLLAYLSEHNGLSRAFIDAHTRDFDEALLNAQQLSLDETARICQISKTDLTVFYQWFCHSTRAVTFYSMGINQSTSGVDKANAIINCHLGSGKIGKTGCGPFSITGQPNAMGGREVGGLSNMLAAHMDLDNPIHRERVQRFWRAPAMASKPGLKAVDLFKKIASGDVKFVWIIATNPVVSMPNRSEVEKALAQCETVVVSDIVQSNDTLAYADIALPATGWSEKDGTVTNSQRTISRQRSILPAPGLARHDWQILCEVAQKMGFEEGFNFSGPAEIFKEHAELTAFENDNERALNLYGLTTLSQLDYDHLRPVSWPVHRLDGSQRGRFFSDGRFFTADGRARFCAITPQLPHQATTPDYPYVLNSGRVRDQWHTMTRTGKTTRLLAHTPGSYVALHPQDADSLGVKASQLVSISAQCNLGEPVIVPARIDSGQRPGDCFIPIHWSLSQGSHQRIGALFNGMHDPLSGQPETKQGAVQLTPAEFVCQGTMVCHEPGLLQRLLRIPEYWATLPVKHAEGARIATHLTPAEFLSKVQKLIDQTVLPDMATFQIKNDVSLALLILSKRQLVCTLWLNQDYLPVPVQWLDSLFEKPVDEQMISTILRQQPGEDFLQGPIVCSCHQVREKPITEAIEQGTDSVEALGNTLKCGTNCGSCRTQLSRLIKQSRSTQTCTVE